MEKYGQYRDRGSGIAPFFPIPSPSSSPLLALYHVLLFFIRLPLLIFSWAVWLALVRWTPAVSALRKVNLWCILGIPGVWFVDIRVDGAHRGSLGKSGRLPEAGDVIAASHTSPLDILYLATIFDPIFTQSYPGSRLVRPLSLEQALVACFCLPSVPRDTIELSKLVAQNQGRVIVVFPETTTSNGRGVLRLSPSLLSVSAKTNIFPVSIRYTPPDVVTPIPGILSAINFSWKLCSRQTHTIRVRVGLPMKMPQQRQAVEEDVASLQPTRSHTGAREITEPEQKSVDAIAEALSRLGRVTTLGLGIEEKTPFVEAWLNRSTPIKKRA